MTDDRTIYGDSHNETSPVSNTPYSSGVNQELLKKAIDEGKQVRATALENAKQALEEAFPNKKNAIKRKLSDGGMDIFTRDKEIHLDSNEVKLVKATMNEQEKLNAEKLHGGMTKRFQKLVGIETPNVDSLVKEIEEEQEVSNENIDAIIIKSKVETQSENSKFLFNFREKLANYPKYLSYDGSVVLCVMLSMKDTAYPSLRNLPLIDQETIKKVVPEKYINDKSFGVVFDDSKDFILTFSSHHSEIHKITMFNTIIHPRPEDIATQGQVKVEKDGEKICVGDKIVLNKAGIKKLIGIELKHETVDEMSMTPKLKQPVSGRNPYELRTDILSMALEYSMADTRFMSSPDDVVNIAKTFYKFVENRR